MQIVMSNVIALKELYPRLKETKMPVRLGYKLVRIFDEIDKCAAIYAQMLSDIINDCAQKDENGKPILTEDGTQVVLIEDKIHECGERMNELNTLSVDIETKYTLTLDDLDCFDSLSIDDIKLLSPFIE